MRSSIGYGVPFPPQGTQRSYLRLYALGIHLGNPPGTLRDELLRAMQGHVLAEGQLLGKYRR